MHCPPRISSPWARCRVLLVIAVLPVFGCKGTETATRGGPADVGGTVVIATPADATTLLPQLISGITDREVTDLLYDHQADTGGGGDPLRL